MFNDCAGGLSGVGVLGGTPPAKKRLEKEGNNHTKRGVSKFFLYTRTQKHRIHRINGFSNVELLFFILIYHVIKNYCLFFELCFESVLALFVKEKTDSVPDSVRKMTNYFFWQKTQTGFKRHQNGFKTG
ncbi:hypothetical protein NI497_000061 [Salmonella enterica]|nr:hypothetical protein [Salmonella enterica]EKC2505890.1 hypothetical protein [Salmonella enterica]EKC3255697.1 hypothetical protein [Salmonella enterica]